VAGDIDIVVGAQDKASAVLNAVAGRVGGFGSSIGKFINPLTASLAGAAAGFLAVGKAIGTVSEAANRIDALTDTAAGLGATVGDLQAFRFAMGEAGNVSAEKSIASLQKLQKTVGEIATGGNAKAGEVFEKLGLDAAKLSMQGPVQQFEAVRQALGSIENVSERAATAQQIFGKSAADLIPVLLAQSGEFEASMNAAAELGAVTSEEGAAGIAAMNDAVGRVSLGFEGLANTVAVAVAPLVESIASTIAGWLPPIIELASQWLPTIVDSAAAMVGFATDFYNTMYKVVTLDFSGAYKTATNALGEQGTAAQLILKAEEARNRAAQVAAENAAKARAQKEAEVAIEKESLKTEQAKTSEAEKTIAALEKKFAIATMGAEAVERQEQLATAATDAERERILALQAQLDLHEQITAEFSSRVEAEKKATAERQRMAEQEQAKRAELVGQLASVPTAIAATQSRLQTRGPAQSGMEKMTKLAEKQLAFLQKIFEKETPQIQPLQLVQVN
jgi:hypothetical protein